MTRFDFYNHFLFSDIKSRHIEDQKLKILQAFLGGSHVFLTLFIKMFINHPSYSLPATHTRAFWLSVQPLYGKIPEKPKIL